MLGPVYRQVTLRRLAGRRAGRSHATTTSSQDRLGQTGLSYQTNVNISTLNTQHTVSLRVRAVSEPAVSGLLWSGAGRRYHPLTASQSPGPSPSPRSPHYLLITLDNFTQAAPITRTDETIFDISQFYLRGVTTWELSQSSMACLSQCGFDVLGWVVCQFSCCTQVVISNKLQLFL